MDRVDHGTLTGGLTWPSLMTLRRNCYTERSGNIDSIFEPSLEVDGAKQPGMVPAKTHSGVGFPPPSRMMKVESAAVRCRRVITSVLMWGITASFMNAFISKALHPRDSSTLRALA